MNTQQAAGPAETQVEMMELLQEEHSSLPSALCRCLQKKVTLFTMMIVIMGLVGIIACQFLTPAFKQDSMPPIGSKNDSQHELAMSYELKQNPVNNQMWNIFTSLKQATYLIHGKVNCEDESNDTVYLDHIWKKGKPSKIMVGKCPELHFTEKVKLSPHSKVYLFFNVKGEKPKVSQMIKVYQLCP